MENKIEGKVSVSFLDSKDVLGVFDIIKDLNVWVHFDVMDNKFVPNTGVDMKYIKTAKNLGMYTDVHLMVENPLGDKYIYTAIENGADSITIHQEIKNFDAVLNRLNQLKKEHNFKIGVSLKPNTDISKLKGYEDKFDLLLLMSVEPGFGGQKYIESTNNKIKEAKKLFKNKIIQVDGGVNFDTFLNPYLSGADSLVVGSYLVKRGKNEILDNYLALNILVDFETIPKDSNIEFDKKLLQIVPGGYGQNDVLLGITSPNLRKFVKKWYKNVSLNTLKHFIISNIHEYRKFGLFCLSSMAKQKDCNVQDLLCFMNENIVYINNWDLTDEIAPNLLGNYLSTLSSDKIILSKLEYYINSDNFWIRRIGIVSCLVLAKNGNYSVCENIACKVMYDDNHLIQKAIGWVLRELYKKEPKKVIEFLSKSNSKKKLPSFVISYACEHMSMEEKNIVKFGGLK